MAKNGNSYILWPLIECCPYQGPIKSVKTTTKVMGFPEFNLDEWTNQSQKWHLAILQKIQTNQLYHLTYQSNRYNVHEQPKTGVNWYIRTITVKANSSPSDKNTRALTSSTTRPMPHGINWAYLLIYLLNPVKQEVVKRGKTGDG